MALIVKNNSHHSNKLSGACELKKKQVLVNRVVPLSAQYRPDALGLGLGGGDIPSKVSFGGARNFGTPIHVTHPEILIFGTFRGQKNSDLDFLGLLWLRLWKNIWKTQK